MENERILELFLELLARAKKSVPLYPPGSDAVREWVQRLHRGIPQLIANGLRFPLRFEAHHVLSGETALLTISPILDALRFDILTRGIEEMTMEEAVEENEVASFLNLLNMDLFAIQEAGGPQAVLQSQGVSHIAVRRIVLTPGVSRGGGLDWGALPVDEQVQLIVDQTLRAMTADLQALALNRIGLTRWLEAVGQGDRPDLIYDGVRTVCKVVASEREPSLFLRTIVEALCALPDSLLLPVMCDWLVPGVAMDVEALNLIRHFSEDELQQLAKLLPEATVLALTAALADLPLEDAGNQWLLESLSGMIRDQGAESRCPASPVEEGIAARVRQMVMDSFQPDGLLETGVRILLVLLCSVESEEYPSSAVDALEESVGVALSRGRLDLAMDILNGVRSGVLRGEWVQEHSRRSAALFRCAADQTHVALLAGLLREHRTGEHAGLTTQYLRLVGEQGIREFVNLLAEEHDRPVRAFMRHVLVLVGNPAVPALRLLTEDRRWYVVRNAVMVLGRIGDLSALPSINAAARHPDPRVRTEVARVLGAWAQSVSLTPLLTLLEDPDPDVKVAAVKILAGLESEEAVSRLQDLALRNTKTIDLSVRREAIRALATMKTRAARQAIREIAHRRLWIWQWQERQLRSLAARAARGEGTP